MPMASVNGVDLYYEETGEGMPLVWVHEYGGDVRSWEPQVRYLSRRYRVVTYNHRGYSPSTVPRAARDYSQNLLVEDLHQLLTHLELGPVHLGGCSMGANVARDFAIAAGLERDGIASLVHHFEIVPNRASFKQKDPRGFAEFLRQVAEHDAQACAHLAREVLIKRKTVVELEAELKALHAPTLIMAGDRDAPSIEPSVLMRGWMPHAGLTVFPGCGHTANLEEPGLFNLHVAEFLAAVERGRWAGWSG